MAGKSVPARGRTFGSLLGVGGLAVLVAAATAACGSETPAHATVSPVVVSTSGLSAPASSAGPSSGASDSGSVPTTGVTSTAPSPPVEASSTGGGATTPIVGLVVTPQAQLTAVPAGDKLTPFESATRNSSGTVLYLGLISQGGACGQYDVVVQQSSSSVGVGLVHLSAAGHVCPMYMGRMVVEAKLSAPLADRSVIDLADGQASAVSLS